MSTAYAISQSTAHALAMKENAAVTSVFDTRNMAPDVWKMKPAEYDLYSLGSQDMPCGGDEVWAAMLAYKREILADEAHSVEGD